MVKSEKSPPEPRKLWSWILVLSIGDSRSTKFIQMMILAWPLMFLQYGQICIPILLYGEKLKNHFPKMYLKTNGWNLQFMIKVVKPFRNDQTFVPCEFSALVHKRIYLVIFKHLFLWNHLTNSHQISHGSFCLRDIDNLLNGYAMLNKMVTFPYMVKKKSLKIFFSRIETGLRLNLSV